MNNQIIFNKCAVKITISQYHYHALGKVIYYRSNLTTDMTFRWRWYFEYLAALVKTNNPRIEVNLMIGPMQNLVGEEYRKKKSEALLKASIARLAKLKKVSPDPDLFGFNVEDYENEEEKIEEKIQQLQSGLYDFYVYPEYINRIREFINYG